MNRLPFSLKLALREIRNHGKFSLFFIANVAFGLVGFLTLNSFRFAVEEAVASRAKGLLGADLSISARRDLTETEQSKLKSALPAGTALMKTMDMYSMAAVGDQSRLVQIRAIEEGYPYRGEVLVEPAQGTNELNRERLAWVYPELLPQLGAKPGASVKIGETSFRVSATVASESSAASEMLALAPRVYIGMRQLGSTKLMKFGATTWHTYLAKLPDGVIPEDVAREIDLQLDDPGVRVATPRNASEQVGRLNGYLNDYLGLAALVAFFLAAVGAAYLFRGFLTRRIREIAILRSLGVGARTALSVYLLQLLGLGAIALIPAALLSAALLPALSTILRSFLPFPLEAPLDPKSLLAGAALGTLGNLLFCLPLLSSIPKASPSLLFQEGVSPSLRFSARSALWFFPALAAYGALAVWQSNSWRVGGAFTAGLIGGAVVLGLGAAAILKLVDSLKVSTVFSRRIAVRNLSRSKLGTISCFLALALGTGLISLIAQIQQSLSREINQPAGSRLPAMFLFDIQEEQAEPLKAFFAERELPLSALSPLVRARLDALNGKPFAKDLSREDAGTREEEQERRSRNRGLNLSYRASLNDSESIVSGDPLPPRTQEEPAPVSVEKEYAKRMGLRIGDRIRLDVQGIGVEARIANLRKIRWTSFQPNFFLLFSEGVLEDAPKTYLASVPSLSGSAKAGLQAGLVKAFPNVSIIDVTRVVERILAVVTQMSWAMTFMATLSLFTGLVVLFSIANTQARLRAWDTALLKVLGADFKSIAAIARWEFGLLGLGAAVAGVGMSWALSYVLSTLVFDNTWAPSWTVSAAALIGVPLASVVIAAIATRRVLRIPPAAFLQGGA